jgi:hypothetical protein
MITMMLGLTLIFGDPLAPPSACTPARVRHWTRPDTSAYVVARITRDSAYAGLYSYDAKPQQTRRPEQTWIQPVYGQIAEVRRSNAFLGRPDARPGQRILIIWWTYSAGCGRALPDPRSRAAIGEEVFITVRPRPHHEWINGIPTYDADLIREGTHWIYIPSRVDSLMVFYPADSIRVSPMSAHEYAEMFNALPGKAMLPWQAGANQLLAWAKRNPGLARKFPACELVSRARSALSNNYASFRDVCGVKRGA